MFSVDSCQNKARYLLNFAGVSRVPVRKGGAGVEGSPRLRPSWATKGKNWSKISTAVSTVGKLKQHVRSRGWGGGGACRYIAVILCICGCALSAEIFFLRHQLRMRYDDVKSKELLQTLLNQISLCVCYCVCV